MEWWLYSIIAIAIFLTCMILNYIINKINDAHLDERLVTLRLKSPPGQVTQVHETALAIKSLTPKISQGKLIIKKSFAVDEPKTSLDDTKGKEIVILSESLEEPSFLLGSVYRNSDMTNATDINKTEVIELADVAQSAQLSEKSEFEVHASTLNELNSNTGQIVILNDVLQKDLLLTIVDETKALTIDSGAISRQQNCSRLILPDSKTFAETHEEGSEKNKAITSSTLSESHRPKNADLPVISTDTNNCDSKSNEEGTSCRNSSLINNN